MAEELERDGIDLENDSYAQANAKIREAQRAAGEMRNAAREDNEYRALDENSQEQYAIMRENGASHDEAMAVLRPSEDLPLFQESLDLAKENQRLDDIYPAYEGETININGQERTVYNSNGDRIAKSKEALENFYRWFGDSKVVDEQGRPLVVYHGTNKEFEVFSKGLLGKTTQAESAKKGFFFTDDTEVADSYADYAAIYQPINELLEKQRQAEKEGNWDLFDKLTIEIEEKDREISQTPANQRGKKVYAVYLKANNVMEYDAKDEYFSDIGEDINKVLDKARKDKKDGVIIKNLKDQPNVYDEKSANHFVVFESNQIKSTSNRGTYSESENNIYWQSMYPSKLESFSKFYDDVMGGENKKPRYFTENINGIKIDIPTNAMWHDGNKHSLNKKEWLGIIKALKKNKIVASAYGDYNRMNGTPIKMIVDVNGVEYGITFEHMQSGRNLLQSAFVLKDKGWIRPKQKKSSQTVANEPQPKSSRLGNSLYDIISNLEENVNREKVLYQSAFAGSRVDYDRPSLEAIGSGEGNQAHGWGLYYALDRDVAEGYRETFTKGQSKLIIGDKSIEELINSYDWNNEDYDIADNMIDEITRHLEFRAKNQKDTYEARQSVLQDIGNYIQDLRGYLKKGSDDEVYIKHVKEDLENVEKLRDKIATYNSKEFKFEEQKGQVHEVDIPENPYLLDEQKPLSEQSDFVKKGLVRLQQEQSIDIKQGAVIDAIRDKIEWLNDIIKDNSNAYEAKEALTEAREDLQLAEENEGIEELAKVYHVELDNLTGKDVYFGLSQKLNSPKAASQMLEKYGIKGITYDGAQDGRCFVIFNPDDVKVIQKFYQSNQSQTGRGGVARGAYSNNIIYLFEHADASTVIHELGHYFLDDLQKYGKSEKSKEQLQAIYNYLGAKDGVITTEMHEYFADSFEVYLKEGKAPNSLLRGVFIKFKNWMRQIFSEVKRLEGVKLTDEMRKTFDEMLGGKSLDFAMQTASENMQANAKSGYIPPSVADFAMHILIIKKERSYPKNSFNKLSHNLYYVY